MSEPTSKAKTIQERALELLKLSPLTKWHAENVNLLRTNQNSEIFIACSGGADSVFALLLIFAAFPKARCRMSVIHFNHSLRGDESDGDQNFVKNLTAELSLNFITKNARDTNKVDEGNLRDERRAFFLETLSQSNSAILIQGHNLDDVAETLLWRIPRGVGVEGICSPRPIERQEGAFILRPFLVFTRKDIRESLQKAHINWRQDSSNKSEKYLRNRLRKNTLNHWKADSDRDLLDGVKRTRELLDEQNQALNQWAEDAYRNSIEIHQIKTSLLSKYPQAIRRKVLTFWLSRIAKLKIIHQHHVDLLLHSINCGDNSVIEISKDLKIIHKQGIIYKKNIHQETIDWGTSYLPFNSSTQLPTGYLLSITLIKGNASLYNKILAGTVNQEEGCYLSIDKTEGPLYFRQKKAGDKFKPMGLKGTKKVKDCMIDRQWEEHKKSSTPIITDSHGKILWIPGFAPDQSSIIDGTETEVIRLTYRHPTAL